MKPCFAKCSAFVFLISTSCGAASLQTPDFALQLPGDWHASPVQKSAHANAYAFTSSDKNGHVAIVVTNSWSAANQDKATLLGHAESMTGACLQSQFDQALPKPLTLNRCDIGGTSGFCAEYVHTPKGEKAEKGICMGWLSDDNLVYTANWSASLPEAEKVLVQMFQAFKAIKLPKRTDK